MDVEKNVGSAAVDGDRDAVGSFRSWVRNGTDYYYAHRMDWNRTTTYSNKTNDSSSSSELQREYEAMQRLHDLYFILTG